MFEIGIQMFSFKEMEPDNLLGAITAAAEMGYNSIELAGLFEHPAEEIRAHCDAVGVKIASTHTGLAFLKPDTIEKTIENHKIFGVTDLVIPHSSLPDPEKRGAVLNAILYAAPILTDAGITLHYHNHSPEFLFDEPYSLYDELCEKTNLRFQIDTYHAFAAGLDPIEVMERYKDRISCVHIRDGMGYQQEAKALGDGKCPVLDCVNYALAQGWTMIVENASWKPDPVSEAKRCIDYLKKNFA